MGVRPDITLQGTSTRVEYIACRPNPAVSNVLATSAQAPNVKSAGLGPLGRFCLTFDSLIRIFFVDTEAT
jgi:hypothetical protein